MQTPPPAAARDASVIATNDDAFMCKVAAVKRNYFEDGFLLAIAESAELGLDACSYRRPPIINRGTFARVQVVQRIVELFLQDVEAGGRAQIVSFGAGYDTLPFRLAEMERKVDVRFVEMDFEAVVRAKGEIAESVPRIGELFDKETDLGADGRLAKYSRTKGERTFTYTLHACDLRDTPSVTSAFAASSIDFSAPTLFLAECVLMYMHPSASDSLLHLAASKFTGPRAFANYEPIKPADAFGRQMISNIAARGSPLLGIDAYPDEASQRRRFREAGWECADAVSMLTAFDRMLSGRERVGLNRVEMLDEVEEWNLIMSHYVVVFARSSDAVSRHPLFEERKAPLT